MVHSGPYTVNPTRPTLERKLVQVSREFLSGRGQDTWSRQATTIENGLSGAPRSQDLVPFLTKHPSNGPLFTFFFNFSIARFQESMAKNWTAEEEEHIRKHFLAQTYGELAEHFGVTTKAMESKIRRMGLKKQAILAEVISPPEPAPVVQYEKFTVPKEPTAEPIESIHKLERRIEVYEETKEERTDRLKNTRDAAETEKARREESRSEASIAQALKIFEAGVKKLFDGKNSEAAKDFQALLDDPPPDMGLVLRARQYLSATLSTKSTEPALKTAEEMYNHGVVLFNDGDIEGALKVLGVAAKQAPKDDRIMYVRALALGASGDEAGATEELQAAITINDANRVYAHNDPDFAPLHDNPRFQELTEPQGEDDID